LTESCEGWEFESSPSWSLFFILLRKRRKYPKGHCQSCGYDLTGNTTGACPECNSEVASQTEAIA